MNRSGECWFLWGGKLSQFPGPLKKIIFGLRCGQDSRRQVQEAAMQTAEGPIGLAEIASSTGSFVLRIRDLGMVSCPRDASTQKATTPGAG